MRLTKYRLLDPDELKRRRDIERRLRMIEYQQALFDWMGTATGRKTFWLLAVAGTVATLYFAGLIFGGL